MCLGQWHGFVQAVSGSKPGYPWQMAWALQAPHREYRLAHCLKVGGKGQTKCKTRRKRRRGNFKVQGADLLDHMCSLNRRNLEEENPENTDGAMLCRRVPPYTVRPLNLNLPCSQPLPTLPARPSSWTILVARS